MVYSKYTKHRILYYRRLVYRAYTISKKLREEGIQTSRRGISKMLTLVLKRLGPLEEERAAVG